jgi:hypothetical protein
VEHKGLSDAWCLLLVQVFDSARRIASDEFPVCPTCVGRLKNARSRRPEPVPFIPLTSGALIEEANDTPSSGLNSKVDEAAGKLGFRTGSDFIRHASKPRSTERNRTRPSMKPSSA